MRRQWVGMTAGEQIREIQLCSIYGSHSGEEWWLQTSSQQKGWHWHFTQSDEQVVFSRVSREREPYQLLFSIGPVISEAHRSILVLLGEGAMEQQSLRTNTHTHTHTHVYIDTQCEGLKAGALNIHGRGGRFISVFVFVNTAVWDFYTWLHNKFPFSANKTREVKLSQAASNQNEKHTDFSSLTCSYLQTLYISLLE